MLGVVSTFFPLPQDRGDPVRVLMTLRALAQRGPFELFVVRRNDTTPEHERCLRDQLPGVDVNIYDPTPYASNRLGPVGRYPQAALERMPPWVRTRYSRRLHDDLRARTGAGLAIGEAAGAYFRGTALRWHWDKANVLAASTRQDVTEAENLTHGIRARYIAHASERFERSALALTSSISVTSQAESDRLYKHYGRVADFALPSCVPLPAYHRAPTGRHLVWLGSFNFRPNLLGLRAFLQHGWPPLRAAGFTLSLIGSGLTPEIRAGLPGHSGVTVLGYVEDLASVLASADAGVVPVWSGAGVKLKTVTLLAHGVPVFATPIGAEGVPPSPAVRLADTPEELSASVLGTSSQALVAMSSVARQLVEAHFTEERFAARLTGELARIGVIPAESAGSLGRDLDVRGL